MTAEKKLTLEELEALKLRYMEECNDDLIKASLVAMTLGESSEMPRFRGGRLYEYETRGIRIKYMTWTQSFDTAKGSWVARSYITIFDTTAVTRYSCFASVNLTGQPLESERQPLSTLHPDYDYCVPGQWQEVVRHAFLEATVKAEAKKNAGSVRRRDELAKLLHVE